MPGKATAGDDLAKIQEELSKQRDNKSPKAQAAIAAAEAAMKEYRKARQRGFERSDRP